MNSERIDSRLSGIPETYLAPFYWMALESQHPDAMISDEKTVALVTQNGVDFLQVRNFP